MKKSIRLLSSTLSCQPMDLSMLATSPRCRPDLFLLKGLQEKNGHKSFKKHTPSSPTKKYRGYWGWTIRNSASWPKYKEGPYPLGQHEMSPKGRISTPQYSRASSTPWRKPLDEWRTNTPSKKGSSKRPSMTFNERGSQHKGSIQNNRSKKPHQGTRKTEERLTSTYHAKMGSVVLPSGSSEWMGEKWLGTLRTTRWGISPSLPISTLRKNITTMTTTTQLGHYQGGFYPPWGGVAPPSPPSIKHSISSPSTTGVLWLRSTATALWMSSANHCVARSTSSSRRSKWLEWSRVSAKDDLKLPEPTNKSDTCGWVKLEPARSRTGLGQTWYARIDKCGMDMGVHSDEE